MKKRIVNLTTIELERLASEAWFAASEAALKSGATVVGREGSNIVKTFPDGHTEILSEAKPLLEPVGRNPAKKKSRVGQARHSA